MGTCTRRRGQSSRPKQLLGWLCWLYRLHRSGPVGLGSWGARGLACIGWARLGSAWLGLAGRGRSGQRAALRGVSCIRHRVAVVAGVNFLYVSTCLSCSTTPRSFHHRPHRHDSVCGTRLANVCHPRTSKSPCWGSGVPALGVGGAFASRLSAPSSSSFPFFSFPPQPSPPPPPGSSFEVTADLSGLPGAAIRWRNSLQIPIFRQGCVGKAVAPRRLGVMPRIPISPPSLARGAWRFRNLLALTVLDPRTPVLPPVLSRGPRDAGP